MIRESEYECVMEITCLTNVTEFCKDEAKSVVIMVQIDFSNTFGDVLHGRLMQIGSTHWI